jgi:hypothetical protein
VAPNRIRTATALTLGAVVRFRGSFGPGLRRLAGFVALSGAIGACAEATVVGEGQFGRPIALASNPERPLPRMIWRPGEACPGPVGGCESFCAGPPASCPDSACLPVLIDSGTPLSIIPSSDGTLSLGQDCIELRAGAGLLDAPDDPASLANATASFRLRGAPMVHAPGDEIDGWEWRAGDDGEPIRIGGVIGGNVLRDFAVAFRHLEGEPPSVAFHSQFPGSEEVLGDQGRAFLRLQHPGRLLGRLLNDRCEIAPGLDCRLSEFSLNQANRSLLFESTRALVDACVAPPPCTVEWIDDECQLSLRSSQLQDSEVCPHDNGSSATLLVATGVPGLVLFDDSAVQLLGPLAELPACVDLTAASEARACVEPALGQLSLPGWPTLEDLVRLRVRSVGIVEGLDQASGASPCQRLRSRLNGLVRQCEGFAVEGRPIRPQAETGRTVSSSAFVVGEVTRDLSAAKSSAWLETLIVPATAAPVIALRREIVPVGAQPDGMIGGALLHDTETVLDFTETVEGAGVRVRCLDPGPNCQAIPSCEPDIDAVEFASGDAGRTSCCYGLPANLIAQVVLDGEDKVAPRVEDICCPALSRAAISDLQSPSLDLCTGVDLP